MANSKYLNKTSAKKWIEFIKEREDISSIRKFIDEFQKKYPDDPIKDASDKTVRYNFRKIGIIKSKKIGKKAGCYYYSDPNKESYRNLEKFFSSTENNNVIEDSIEYIFEDVPTITMIKVAVGTENHATKLILEHAEYKIAVIPSYGNVVMIGDDRSIYNIISDILRINGEKRKSYDKAVELREEALRKEAIELMERDELEYIPEPPTSKPIMTHNVKIYKNNKRTEESQQ